MKKTEYSVIGGLFLAMIISFFTDINFQANEIRENTLRLHVIANDNSAQSQYIKMQVKDTINSVCSQLYCPAESFNQAISITDENLEYINQITDNVLKNLGVDYTSMCSLEKFYFDTTEYGDFTMPRGYYTALTVRLGEAQGKNWWCVVYPSLCRSIGAEYKDDNSNSFIETDNFRIKFKAVELWQDFKQFVSGEEIEKYDKI